MQNKRKSSTAGIGITLAILILCNLASLTVIFGRVLTYTEAKFVNVMPINQVYVPEENSRPGGSAPDLVAMLSNAVIVVTTLYSGAEYLIQNRDVFKDAD